MQNDQKAKIQTCFLPRRGPLLRADALTHPAPLAPLPAAESKLSLAKPRAGAQSEHLPSTDTRPHGLKGSQG